MCSEKQMSESKTRPFKTTRGTLRSTEGQKARQLKRKWKQRDRHRNKSSSASYAFGRGAHNGFEISKGSERMQLKLLVKERAETMSDSPFAASAGGTPPAALRNTTAGGDISPPLALRTPVPLEEVSTNLRKPLRGFEAAAAAAAASDSSRLKPCVHCSKSHHWADRDCWTNPAHPQHRAGKRPPCVHCDTCHRWADTDCWANEAHPRHRERRPDASGGERAVKGPSSGLKGGGPCRSTLLEAASGSSSSSSSDSRPLRCVHCAKSHHWAEKDCRANPAHPRHAEAKHKAAHASRARRTSSLERGSERRKALFEEHVITCIEKSCLKRQQQQCAGDALPGKPAELLFAPLDGLDAAAARRVLRASLFAPFSELVAEREAVACSELVWAEWADLPTLDAARRALSSRVLHRLAIGTLAEPPLGPALGARLLDAMFRELPWTRPHIWQAMEAAMRMYLEREAAIVRAHPELYAQPPEVGTPLALRLGSIMGIAQLWRAVSSGADTGSALASSFEVEASVCLFRLCASARAPPLRADLHLQLQDSLPHLLAAAPQAGPAALSALLKLVRDAMKAGDSQHAVLLLRLLKGAVLVLPPHQLQGQYWATQRVLLTAIRSPHHKISLEALGIVGNTYVLVQVLLVGPWGYGSLSEALCANRVHWHAAIREQSEKCYDAILDYA